MTNPIREKQIAAGKLWQISPVTDPDTVTFEGSRAKRIHWLRVKGEIQKWKRGKSGYTLGKVIWEDSRK